MLMLRYIFVAVSMSLLALCVLTLGVGFRYAMPWFSFGVLPGGVLVAHGSGSLLTEELASPWLLVTQAPCGEPSLLLRGPEYSHDGFDLRSRWRIRFSLWYLFVAGSTGAALCFVFRRRWWPLGQCQSCGYDLTGTGARPCPECGAAPTHVASSAGHPRATLSDALRPATRLLLNPLAMAVLTWILALSPFCGLLSCLVLGCTVIAWLMRARTRAAVLLLFLSPVVMLPAYSATLYLRGNGQLLVEGLLDSEMYSMDPRYRCERVTGRWGIAENGWLVDGLCNVSLRALVGACGPMRGAYLGPIPSRHASVQATADSQEVVCAELVEDSITVAGTTVHLARGVGEKLIRGREWALVHEGLDTTESMREYVGPLRVALLNGCLVLRVPDGMWRIDWQREGFVVIVIDVESGRPITYYAENVFGPAPAARWAGREE